MTNKDIIEDLLIEFDELDMQPILIVPNPVGRAEEWKRQMIYAIDRLKAEVAREIFEEISQIKKEYASGDIDGNELYVRLYLLEKKYTEEKE